VYCSVLMWFCFWCCSGPALPQPANVAASIPGMMGLPPGTARSPAAMMGGAMMGVPSGGTPVNSGQMVGMPPGMMGLPRQPMNMYGMQPAMVGMPPQQVMMGMQTGMMGMPMYQQNMLGMMQPGVMGAQQNTGASFDQL